MSAATHLLIHRFTPGTGPSEGSPEFDDEMRQWERIDTDLRESGTLIGSFALDAPSSSLGATPIPSPNTVFAVHAIAVESDAAATRVAEQMPHLAYGSIEVRPLMNR